MPVSISVSVYLYIYKLKEIEHGDKYQTLVSFGRKRKGIVLLIPIKNFLTFDSE